MKTNKEIFVAQVSNRGKNRFAVVMGSVIFTKFKSLEAAKESLESKKSFYEYWAGSVSVSVDNSKKNYVKLA